MVIVEIKTVIEMVEIKVRDYKSKKMQAAVIYKKPFSGAETTYQEKKISTV